MLDFSSVPVIDNHCHPMDPAKAILEPIRLAKEVYHGSGDIPKPDVKAKQWGASEELQFHFPYIGLAQTMVCQLARVLECPAELEAVAAERNRRTSVDFGAYARLLYEDAGIVATVLDSDLATDAPVLKLLPGKLMRLFQQNPAIKKALQATDSYAAMLLAYQESLQKAVKVDGFVGVKSHLGEEVGFGAPLCTDAEAESVFAAAKAGDGAAYKRIYMAVTMATLLQARELGIPVHFHCGITGGFWDGPVSDADPFALGLLLKRPEFVQTKVVLLHGAYPWVQHAAAVAHALPNIWVDMGWLTPWISLRIAEAYREVIGIAPLSKIIVGSGCHGTPEVSWLAGITAKIGLAKALGDAVEMSLMTRDQAEKAGRMILHDNAARLYGLA